MERILLLLLHATTMFWLVATDCPGHVYHVDGQTFDWPGVPNSGVWYPSECLDKSYQLIFRKCEDDEWTPDNTNFQSLCFRRMFKGSMYDVSPGEACYEVTNPARNCFTWKASYYNECSPGHISFMELNIDEREELLTLLSRYYATNPILFANGGTNRWPVETISSLMNYDKGKVELHDTRCGRYGLPLKFSTKTVPVHCSEDKCVDMCLSVNVSGDPLSRAMSGVVTIEKCSQYKLSVYRPIMTQYRCPIGYYRLEYEYGHATSSSACFSIQKFRQPIPVQDLETENVVKTYCNGTMMRLLYETQMLIFMQLSQAMKLTDRNNCLFGLTSNDIIKHSDWNSNLFSRTSYYNFKWDESMNYSRVLSGVSYLAINANGKWTWATDTVSCVACMFNAPIQTPELLLKFNFLTKYLELEVKHQDSLHKEDSSDAGFICFAVIDQTYKSNLTIYPDVHSAGKYQIENVGKGQYWCSGHSHLTFIFCSSAVINAYGMVFVLKIVKKCDISCSFNDKDFNQFVENFKLDYNFVKVLDSAVVHSETADSDTEFNFVAHLSLVLQDETAVDLDTNLVSLTHRQIETIFIYEKLNKLLVGNESNGLVVRSISSTEYCLHKSTLSLDAIIWGVANVEETVPTSVLCPPDQHCMTRYCASDTVYGTFWNELVNARHCYSIVSQTLLELYVNFNNSRRDIEDLKIILQDNVRFLLPIDVFLTSRILQKVYNVTLDSLANIASIYNSLMKTDGRFLKIAAYLNSTNILLEALDNILLSSHINSDFKDGNVSIHSPLIKTFVLTPVISGLSGVSLYRPRSSSASDVDFADYSSRYIHPNESIDELLHNLNTGNDLVIGSYLPANMLATLHNVSVAIIVFFNDKLFQSIDVPTSKSYFQTNGKIISVSIFEFDNNLRLPSRLPIFFETSRIDDSTCGYWSFASDFWSSDGCDLTRVNHSQHLALCECSHLTHFGYLVDNDRHEVSEINERALTIITIIGTSFSLFGNLGIFVTAVVFPNWRNKLSSKILLHFSASITLQMCLMNVANVDAIASHNLACVAMGSALHYSILVMHFWMLIIAYFQFKRYVIVFNFTINHLLLKSAIFGWLVPILPVITVLVSDYSLYLPINKDELKFCYPTGYALTYGVLVPIGIIFAVDVIVYLSVVVSLNRGFSDSTCKSEATKLRAKLSQIRLFAFLFFTLGLTWIFGFLSKVQPNSYLVFTYLFCITSTVQGLVLFFYFTVLDPYVRSLWLRYFQNILGRE